MTRMKAARLPLATTSGRASRISARDAKAVAPGALLAPAPAPAPAFSLAPAAARSERGRRRRAIMYEGSAMAGSS